MFNPFETQSIDEMIPFEYEDFLDEVDEDFLDAVEEANMSGAVCVKCGETISRYEIDVNDGRCPCCDSIFVLHNSFIKEVLGEDILI